MRVGGFGRECSLSLHLSLTLPALNVHLLRILAVNYSVPGSLDWCIVSCTQHYNGMQRITFLHMWLACIVLYLMSCTDSRGAVAVTHCHGLYRQIPRTLHCPSPACSNTPLTFPFLPLPQDKCPLMISIQSSSQAPYVGVSEGPCRCHVTQTSCAVIKWPCGLRINCVFLARFGMSYR